MSKYTTLVRHICENNAGLQISGGESDIENILEKSWNKIFNNNWEIFDEQYRKKLCKKILSHYYMQEIGFETVGMWKFALNRKMSEIMPYYNKIYASINSDYNLLKGETITRTYDDNETGAKTNNTTHNIDKNTNSSENNTTNNSYNGELTNTTIHKGDSTNSDVHKGDSSNTINHIGGYSDNVNNTQTVNIELSGSSDNVQRMSDTPQNGLSDVLSDKYLTSIQADSNNNSQTTNQSNTNIGTTTSNDKFEDTNTSNDNYTNTNTSNDNYTDTNTNNTNYTDNSTITKTRGVIENENGTNNSTENATNNKSGNETTTKTLSGNEIVDTINNYIDKLRNVDMQIISEISDLFMQIW